MNPYEESLLAVRRTELADEIRSIQLAGDGGAQRDSETELFRFASVRRGPRWIAGWLVAILHRLPIPHGPAHAARVEPANEAPSQIVMEPVLRES